jgi:hypothetical protein
MLGLARPYICRLSILNGGAPHLDIRSYLDTRAPACSRIIPVCAECDA